VLNEVQTVYKLKLELIILSRIKIEKSCNSKKHNNICGRNMVSKSKNHSKT